MPVGSAPLDIDQVIGVVPVATTLWLYALPTEATGREVVVICGTIEQVRLNAFELYPAAFSAFTVMLDVPAVEGVPEITPVLPLKLKPFGKTPPVIDIVSAVPAASIF
jgi:hypothetical protein